MVLVVPQLLVIFLSHLVYRLLFIGSLSRVPKKVTGLSGSLEEFLSGVFMLQSCCTLFGLYAFVEWDPSGHTSQLGRSIWDNIAASVGVRRTLYSQIRAFSPMPLVTLCACVVAVGFTIHSPES